MRSLIFLSAITLFFSSCSNQEEIEKYQKQLRESNEALEEIINYRKILIKSRAVENPSKALKWLKITEVYDSICEGVMEGTIDFNSAPVTKLQLINDTLFIQDRPKDLSLKRKTHNDSLLLKNSILNHLNKWLQRMAITTDPNFCGYEPLQINPTFIRLGDSTLVNLNSNFCINQNKYLVSIKTPDGIDFIDSHSLGHFFIPTQIENPEVSGEVEFIEHSVMRAIKLSFNNDTTYFIQ